MNNECVNKLSEAADALERAAKAMRELLEENEAADAAEKDTQTVKEPAKEKVTKDMLFSLMSEKSQNGYTMQIKAALNELGAKKLSSVEEKDYRKLYDMLMTIGEE